MKKSPANKKNEVGNRYGKLVILEEHPERTKGGGVCWRCLCDCGNETIVRGNYLRSGRTKSCGCLRKLWKRHRYKWAEHLTRATIHNYAVYKKGAKQKGREFTLTIDEFQELILRPCHYCGLPPNNKHVTHQGEVFYYSGIDRVDSKRGYTPDNVVPCCIDCNYAKRDRTSDEFYLWIDRLVSHQYYRGKCNETSRKVYPCIEALHEF